METGKRRKQPKKGGRPLIPLDEFMREAERLKKQALQVLQRDGTHVPILIAFTDTGMEVVGFRVTDDRPMHEVVAAFVRRRKARAFVCIAEAWMVYGPGAAEAIPPSRHPERRQVLSVSAIHPEGKAMWCYPFASEGGKVVLGAPVDSTGMTLGGGIPEALGGEKEDER